jgi:hypothetical protein
MDDHQRNSKRKATESTNIGSIRYTTLQDLTVNTLIDGEITPRSGLLSVNDTNSDYKTEIEKCLAMKESKQAKLSRFKPF